MKILAATLTALSVSFALLCCGPGTPGTGIACGPAPDPAKCPDATCLCFMVQCGWSCSGSQYVVWPDGGVDEAGDVGFDGGVDED